MTWRVALAALLALPVASGFAQTPAPAPSTPDAWLPRGGAELLLLDKLRAAPSSVTIKAGQAETFGTLTIAVKSCVVRPADQAQNAAAFLDITDRSGAGPAFHGWVLSGMPSVSQFEHPVYDLRLAGCK